MCLHMYQHILHHLHNVGVQHVGTCSELCTVCLRHGKLVCCEGSQWPHSCILRPRYCCNDQRMGTFGDCDGVVDRNTHEV